MQFQSNQRLVVESIWNFLFVHDVYKWFLFFFVKCNKSIFNIMFIAFLYNVYSIKLGSNKMGMVLHTERCLYCSSKRMFSFSKVRWVYFSYRKSLWKCWRGQGHTHAVIQNTFLQVRTFFIDYHKYLLASFHVQIICSVPTMQLLSWITLWPTTKRTQLENYKKNCFYLRWNCSCALCTWHRLI